MKKETQKRICLATSMLAAFVLWTVLICFVDVQAIGPKGSKVGLAGMNGFVHSFIGVHMSLYTITDWLGLVPFGFAMIFALLGLIQWLQRKKLMSVDRSILVLGVYYVVVIGLYVLFEVIVLNYRPVLIDGRLEASYPSSTTMLVLCVMPTVIMQCNVRIKNRYLKKAVSWAITVYIIFMLVGRLISGVHWVSDIVGGGLLSSGVVMMYDAASGLNSSSLNS